MKLNEIEWINGKKYEVSLQGYKRIVIVEACRLRVLDDYKVQYLDELFNTFGFAHCDFTPIEKSLTFLDAYQDCEKNGTTYADKHNICIVRRDSNGKVELKVRNSVVDYTVVCVGRMEFTKVVD